MLAISQDQWGDCDSLFLDHGGDVISSAAAKYALTLFRVSSGDSA